jgi:hypothetical protein
MYHIIGLWTLNTGLGRNSLGISVYYFMMNKRIVKLIEINLIMSILVIFYLLIWLTNLLKSDSKRIQLSVAVPIIITSFLMLNFKEFFQRFRVSKAAFQLIVLRSDCCGYPLLLVTAYRFITFIETDCLSKNPMTSVFWINTLPCLQAQHLS